MYKQKGYLTFYALTPIHMGSGQSVSFVDNVVQRERHTSYPTLWSSGIKGVVRELAYRKWNDKDKVNVIFGPEEGSDQYASCISITDAKILLFPVRSVKGTFAWITCPFVLKRLKEDLKSIGKEFKDNQGNDIQIPDNIQNEKVILCSSSDLKIDNNQVAFEEFVFDIENNQNSDNIAEEVFKLLPQTEFNEDFFKNHFAIVSDDVFKDFVNYAVEIRTRIRIDQTTGTVKEGALFSEELIPSESVFYSLVFISEPYNKSSNLNSADDVLRELSTLFPNGHQILQLGADETLGKGFVKVKFEKINTNQKSQTHGGQNP
ncbi:MAG: type III-B CRISPR module RAMP protein Cmr4 [candidate division WOR-3 bacterium]